MCEPVVLTKMRIPRISRAGLSSLFDAALRKELMTLLRSQLGLVVELTSWQRKGKEEELSWR